jgi:uncharacterized protein YndB with AHSA1/START domain
MISGEKPRGNVAKNTMELVKRWWGPKGFISPEIKIDLRVSGKYLCCMQSPEGQDFYFSDKDGNN